MMQRERIGRAAFHFWRRKEESKCRLLFFLGQWVMQQIGVEDLGDFFGAGLGGGGDNGGDADLIRGAGLGL